MRGNARSDPSRNQQLALASIHVRLHDDTGLYRRARNLSNWQSIAVTRMQDILAILIAAAAAAFLAYRGWQRLAARRAGCGACSHCPSNSSLKATPLVTISPIVSQPKLTHDTGLE